MTDVPEIGAKPAELQGTPLKVMENRTYTVICTCGEAIPLMVTVEPGVSGSMEGTCNRCASLIVTVADEHGEITAFHMGKGIIRATNIDDAVAP